jgi:DNA-binding transcriptional MerR regulator
MNKKNKNDEAYKTIGEVAAELNLIDKKTGSLQTHTLRYWEKQFKEIKPKILSGKRRYYSKEDLNTVKFIMHLLKDRGLTIKGVKKVLLKKSLDTLDENVSSGIFNKNLNVKNTIKTKLKNISKKLVELKKIK